MSKISMKNTTEKTKKKAGATDRAFSTYLRARLKMAYELAGGVNMDLTKCASEIEACLQLVKGHKKGGA